MFDLRELELIRPLTLLYDLHGRTMIQAGFLAAELKNSVPSLDKYL